MVDFCDWLGEKPQEYPNISRFFDNDRRKKMPQEKASYLEYVTLVPHLTTNLSQCLCEYSPQDSLDRSDIPLMPPPLP